MTLDGDVRLAAALRDIARGLTAFGVLALALAAITLAGTLVASVRLGSSGASLVMRIERLAGTLDTAATAIDEGGDAAVAFGGTLDTLRPTLERTVTTLRNGAVTLRDLGGAAGAVNIFGSRPLAGTASALDRSAADFDTLAASIETSAATLERSQEGLAGAAEALPPVATNLRRVTENLAPDVEELVSDARWFVLGAGLVVALGLGVAGGGAVILGRRLRRALLAEDLARR